MSARCHGKEIPLYSKWITFRKKENELGAFVHSSALAVSSRTTLAWTDRGARREKEGFLFFFFFFFPPPLHFRKTENDLSKAMIQGYVMDGFVLLCLSIFHSFLRCHSLCFFSLRKAIISITLHISAKFAVSVHAWPKGRKSHSVGVEFHFLARTYCFLWFARGVELQCDILFFFFFLTARTRYSEGTAATAVIEILIRNKCVYMRLPPPPEMAGWLRRCIS